MFVVSVVALQAVHNMANLAAHASLVVWILLYHLRLAGKWQMTKMACNRLGFE